MSPVTGPTAPATPRRVAIVTLGCGRNEVDSEQLAGLFHREGDHLVDDPADADVVLVNTCTFIAPAKQESVDTVLAACQLKDDADARAVLVVGCMAQRYPHELADAIPEADAVVGFDGYGRLPQIVDDVLAGVVTDRVIGVGSAHPGSRPTGAALPLIVTPSPDPGGGTAVDDATPAGSAASRDPDRVLALEVLERTGPRPEPALDGQDALDRAPASGPRFPIRHRTAAGPRAWAYLKIASGCDRVCTFCAIPSFRGRFRSRTREEILAEAAWLTDQGVRELVLVSENTTSWGKDLPGGRGEQPRLLRELAEVDGVERIRLMYLQPAELTGPLLEAIATEPKVASYYDLSLQHVSAPVVRRMARSGDATRFAELIARARDLDPDAVFRSNFILGFPGETESDVDVLEEFLVDNRLDWVGLFPFSREDGTPSDAMDAQVPDDVTSARLERIRDVQEALADDAARRYIGRHLDVVVDEVVDDGDGLVTSARSYREAPDTDGEVRLVGPDGRAARLPVGSTTTVEVVDAVGVDLIGRLAADGVDGV